MFSNSDPRQFTVYITSTEYKQLCSWVLKFDHLETGGDLFGLWRDKHTAVVQLVLGPGGGCRRTGTSFYQDVQYLGNVGSYLTHKEGLCHIGEWHSHHKLGLTRPSGGDENTVWSNMPSYGLSRFILFIATIGREDAVNVGCFLFETDAQIRRRYAVLRGRFELLPDDLSPFRLKEKVWRQLREGAESLNTDIDLLAVEKYKGDFLVSKSWKAKQKRSRSGKETSEKVGKRGVQPPAKRIPQETLNGRECAEVGGTQSPPRDHQQAHTDGAQRHPFSPDAKVSSGGAASREGNHSDDQEKTSSSKTAGSPPGITLQRSRDSGQKEQQRAEAAERNADHQRRNSERDATVTDQPGTPSGTVRQLHCTMGDDDTANEPSTGIVATLTSCFRCGGKAGRKGKFK